MLLSVFPRRGVKIILEIILLAIGTIILILIIIIIIIIIIITQSYPNLRVEPFYCVC